MNIGDSALRLCLCVDI